MEIVINQDNDVCKMLMMTEGLNKCSCTQIPQLWFHLHYLSLAHCLFTSLKVANYLE